MFRLQKLKENSFLYIGNTYASTKFIVLYNAKCLVWVLPKNVGEF